MSLLTGFGFAPKSKRGRPKKVQVEYTFSFGKHKGNTVQSVCESDPSYIKWVLKEWFENQIEDGWERLPLEAYEQMAEFLGEKLKLPHKKINIPAGFNFYDSYVPHPAPKENKDKTGYTHYLELEKGQEVLKKLKRKNFTSPNIKPVRVIYLLVWTLDGINRYGFKVGKSEVFYQRINNYRQATGANTSWLTPAMQALLEEVGGKFEIYIRTFDEIETEQDPHTSDLMLERVIDLSKIEKYYREQLGIKDGKVYTQEFVAAHGCSYIIK